MSDSKSKIDEIAAKGEGMTVPEGYFADFATKMSGRLPFREVLDTPVAEQSKPVNTGWTRVRPYVYMAAMFAGAWCLLKMFTLMTADRNDINIDNYPALSQALQNEQFVNEYIIDDIGSYELVEDYYAEGLVEVPDNITVADTDADAEPSYRLPTDSYDQMPIQ